MSNRCRSLLLAGLLSLAALGPATWAQSAPTPAPAAAATAAPAAGSLDDRIQDAKADVIRLNRDLLVLEEELLFPASTQVAIFVSMDVGKIFLLDSVRVKLDDKDVAAYLYTPAEVQALHRGGVQRVYLGNLRAGSHEGITRLAFPYVAREDPDVPSGVVELLGIRSGEADLDGRIGHSARRHPAKARRAGASRMLS